MNPMLDLALVVIAVAIIVAVFVLNPKDDDPT